MFIGIDKDFRIKQIAIEEGQIVNTTLTVLEVDRQAVFGNWTDRRILAYCYKPSEYGYSIYPARSLSNIEIKELDDQLAATQEAVDFILMNM